MIKRVHEHIICLLYCRDKWIVERKANKIQAFEWIDEDVQRPRRGRVL